LLVCLLQRYIFERNLRIDFFYCIIDNNLSPLLYGFGYVFLYFFATAGFDMFFIFCIAVVSPFCIAAFLCRKGVCSALYGLQTPFVFFLYRTVL